MERILPEEGRYVSALLITNWLWSEELLTLRTAEFPAQQRKNSVFLLEEDLLQYVNSCTTKPLVGEANDSADIRKNAS